MKKLLSVLFALLLTLTLTAGCQSQPVQTPTPPTQAETVTQPDGYIAFTKSDLDKANAQQYVKPKNVIVMISDGMGLNDIVLANKFSDFLFDFGVAFENLKNKGDMTTSSLSGITDSAASGTDIYCETLKHFFSPTMVYVKM